MLKNVPIYQSDDIENVSMIGATIHLYYCYLVAIAAYNGVQHFRSPLLGIRDAPAQVNLHTKKEEKKQPKRVSK